MPIQRSRAQSNYGYPNPQSNLFPSPIVAQRAPLVSDKAEVGQLWVDRSAQTSYILCDIDSAGDAIWVTTPSGAGAFASVTVNPGDIDVTAGDINVPVGDITVGGAGNFGTLAAGDSAFTNDVAITNDLTVGGNLDVTGDVTITGDFDITSVDALQITSTANAAGAIYLQANGGVLDTILIRNLQGTDPDSIEIVSTAGGLALGAGLNTANAVQITATDAAGGISLDAGTGGIDLTALNGVITLASGTGTISVGADAGSKIINIGTGAASANTISIGGAGANTIALGNTQTGGSVAIGAAMTTGTITIGGTGAQTGNFILAPSTGAQTVTLANNNGAKTINIGNGVSGNTISIGNGINTSAQIVNIANGASGANTTVNIMSGIGTAGAGVLAIGNNTRVTTIGLGNIAPAAARTITIAGGDSAQDDTVNILAGNPSANNQTVNILSGTPTGGTSVLNLATGSGILKTVNIATGTLGNTVNIATGVNTVAQTVNISSGAAAGNSTVNILSGNKAAGTSTVNIATGTGGKTVNIANGAGANIVEVGSNNTTSSLTLRAGTGGMILDANGDVSIDPDVATVASPTAASTQNFRVLRTIFTGFTTASAASQAFTINSTAILTTSGIFVTVANLNASTNNARMVIDGITQAAGSIVVTAKNNGAGALGAGDNVIITVFIIS